MNTKLMIAATATALAALLAPALSFTSFATEAAVSTETRIDYAATDLFHSKFSIVEKGRPRIAYDAVRKNAERFLDSYIQHLSNQNVENRSTDAQLAYWLNVQNIVAIDAISFDTKKSNLKKLRGSADEPGKLWNEPRFTYGGETLSLADIENRIVNNSEDPNVLYGVYQGVRGGPRLSRTAYQPETVRATLAKAAKTYINSSGIVSAKNGVVNVAPVLTWHADALFDGDDAQLISHLRTHAYPRLATKLGSSSSVESIKLNYRTDNYRPPAPRGYSSTGSSISGGSSPSYGS